MAVDKELSAMKRIKNILADEDFTAQQRVRIINWAVSSVNEDLHRPDPVKVGVRTTEQLAGLDQAPSVQ
jgi:hypothetical protein